jgi:K+-sensing histidine kinase KdpD
MHGRIFERFQRGKRLDGDDQGSGLGLAIVQAVARAHGGSVELESKVGYGSTFSIHIPQRTNFSLRIGAGERWPLKFMQSKFKDDTITNTTPN